MQVWPQAQSALQATVNLEPVSSGGRDHWTGSAGGSRKPCLLIGIFLLSGVKALIYPWILWLPWLGSVFTFQIANYKHFYLFAICLYTCWNTLRGSFEPHAVKSLFFQAVPSSGCRTLPALLKLDPRGPGLNVERWPEAFKYRTQWKQKNY